MKIREVKPLRTRVVVQLGRFYVGIGTQCSSPEERIGEGWQVVYVGFGASYWVSPVRFGRRVMERV